MNQFEANIVNSFKEVKKDILELKSQVLSLAERHERLESIIDELRGKKAKKSVKKIR